MMNSANNLTGDLMLVLHCHLPFVRHPEYENFLEERWLFEAITETYLPIVSNMQNWENEGIPYKITLNVSPPLCAMLNDQMLQERYRKYLNDLIQLSEQEIDRTRNEEQFNNNAKFYHWFFSESFRKAESYNWNLLTPLRELYHKGNLEIITCCATHGFLPLLQSCPQRVEAQLENGVESHWNHFGLPPQGIWLAECGYAPGVEKVLAKLGVRYFFVDTHAVLNGDPQPPFGPYSAYFTESGVACFARDPECSLQIWSADHGYPGDPNYRDFYRDVGFDRPIEEVEPFLPRGPYGPQRILTGVKYYRITGKTDHKEVYHPEVALERASSHAGNFMFNRVHQFSYLRSVLERKPVIVAPFDAELFGHWWFEGPQFIDFLVRKVAFDQTIFKLNHPRHHLDDNPTQPICTPETSSWGNKGYSDVWLEDSNEWIWYHLTGAAVQLSAAQKRSYDNPELATRVLRQLSAELILAESSDWPFIMSTGTSVDYAVRRLLEHLGNFSRLLWMLEDSEVDLEWLQQLEERHLAILPSTAEKAQTGKLEIG